jgi:hypothetical protein
MRDYGFSEECLLPILLIVEHIMPLLDRETWNSCTLVCKDIYQTSQSGHPPRWPQRRFEQEECKALSFSPDGMFLAVGVFLPMSNGQIHLYHVRRGLIQTLRTERFRLDLLEWPSLNTLMCTKSTPLGTRISFDALQ